MAALDLIWDEQTFISKAFDRIKLNIGINEGIKEQKTVVMLKVI